MINFWTILSHNFNRTSQTLNPEWVIRFDRSANIPIARKKI